MAVSNIPTADKRANQRKNKTVTYQPVFGWFILCIILSITAGFFAGVLARVYPSNWPLASALYQSVGDIGVDITQPVVFVSPEDEDSAVFTTLDVLQKRQAETVVQLYEVDAAGILSEAPIGYGVILSSDGWIVTSSQLIADNENVRVVLGDNTVHEADVIIANTYDNTTYLHIDASQLPVADFADANAVVGSTLYAYGVSAENGVYLEKTSIASDQYHESPVLSTQAAPFTYLVDEPVATDLIGAPVFNAAAKMVGIVMGENTVLPSEYIANAVYGLFQNQAIPERDVVIEYDPLYFGVHEDVTQGAVVTAVSGIGTADIQVGDVLLRVDGQDISPGTDLSQYINAQTLGTQVEIELERTLDGETTVETVVLNVQ